MDMKWAKILKIYDFIHYSCYPKKKISFMWWKLSWASCPEYIHTLIQSVFSPYRVSEKMENAIKWAKNWCIRMYQSIFGLKDPKRLSLINFFWESSYSDWSHIFQFSVYFMALSIFRTPYMVKIHLE